MLSGLNSISAVRLHTAQRLRWPAWLFRWWIEKEPNPSEATEVIRSATSPQLVGRDVLAFARGRSLYAAGFDSRATRLTGEPRAMGIDVQTTLYQAGPMYAVARNGTLVYAQPPGGRRLVWVDRSDKEEFVNAPEQMYSHFRLSPDGTRVAAYLLDGDRDLSVIGLDGSLGVKLTTGAARDVMPVWSPDGKTIYFTTAERNINRVPADGSTAAQTIYQQPAPGRLHATSITPDGKRRSRRRCSRNRARNPTVSCRMTAGGLRTRRARSEAGGRSGRDRFPRRRCAGGPFHRASDISQSGRTMTGRFSIAPRTGR
jgi:hypothetical protein